MAPRTQAILVGSVAGVAAWVGWFLLYAKAKQPELARIGAQIAPQIAEEAAKAYIARNYGLTPEIMQRISARAGLITNVVDAFRR
jgi:hypothetical protein